MPTGMKIPGEELNGVYGANTLLEIGNHPDYTNKNVALVPIKTSAWSRLFSAIKKLFGLNADKSYNYEDK